MQFKYPEILYALLLLLIPVFIHLFQLRRFEKVAFTNVDFLKKIELQTRKSSKLKQFLILLSRLGLFATLIIAFAQPYFSKAKIALKPKTVLYLDNSLSMQAKNRANEMFTKTIQDVISNYNSLTDLTVITNDNIYKELNNKDLKNQLLSFDYSPFSKNLNTVLLQASKTFKLDKGFKKNIILVSDFQSNIVSDTLLLNEDIQYSFVQLKPQNNKNISLDSIYIAKQNGLNIDVNIVVKSHNVLSENVSVSLFKEDILVGKTTCSLEKNKSNTVTFQIPFNDNFNGKILIEDNLIRFDNELFFSLNKVEKINVLAIGNKNEFLSKIYTNSEFNLTNSKLNQVDYNKIANQNIIILNELDIIPLSIQKPLVKFISNGGSLVVIPSLKSNIDTYNQLFSSLKIGSISDKKEIEYQVNKINFSHPILDNVFEKRISNFQYPNVKSVYSSLFNNANYILKFSNQESFISEIKINKGKLYWIASPINQNNSNFKNSPLIVPVFYNFGKQSFKLSELYYTIGQKNSIDVKTSLTNDTVLQVEPKNVNSSNVNFIPLQQVLEQKVVLTIADNPLKSGFFEIKKGNQNLKNIAFNYDRIESITTYADIKKLTQSFNNTTYSNSIKQTFEQIESQFKTQNYWQWFLALAILFLILEMLLMKFLKNG